MDKFSISTNLPCFFNGKIVEGQATAIKDMFNLNVVTRYEKYLGLPSVIARKKMGFFIEVKLKILNKISCWQHKKFSREGKEILIKVVAQAVPTYAMSVFKLLKSLCDEIQRAIAKFCWGSKDDKQDIH